MNDLISRQALIEHLRRTIEASSNDGDYNEGFNDGMDYAACFASTLPSAQPELIEKAAYIRGFEQGRTQGMIDSQGGKK